MDEKTEPKQRNWSRHTRLYDKVDRNPQIFKKRLRKFN